jgi:hypothetical protein
MLQKETEKRTYSNNTEKGKDGENMIESYIIDNEHRKHRERS